MDTRCEAFAERLREARRQRQETQVEAAQHMGIANATLSVLERFGNLGTTRFGDVLALCRYYGWPLDEVAALCFGDGTTSDGIPPEVVLLFRALTDEHKSLVIQAVAAMAKGLAQ